MLVEADVTFLHLKVKKDGRSQCCCPGSVVLDFPLPLVPHILGLVKV